MAQKPKPHWVASIRGNPYGPPPKLAPVDPEPPAKKIIRDDVIIVEPAYPEPEREVYQLHPPAVVMGYYDAWLRLNRICSAEPLAYRECKGKDGASIVLVQVLDTMGVAARIEDWVQRTFGGRVFVYGDDTLEDFLQVTRAGHAFGGTTSGAASAIFLYPTTFVLERLLAAATSTRLIVAVDDMYDPAIRSIRAVAQRLVFVKPLPRGVLATCCALLRQEWKLPDRSQFWLNQAGADPRKLLHMMYFDRLNLCTLGVAWRFTLDWDWERLVNFWFMHGPQRLFEYSYNTIVNVPTTGVVSTQLRGAQGMAVSAWEFAIVPKTYQQRNEVVLPLDEVKGMALPYLHYAAPHALCCYIKPDTVLFDTAYGEVADVLSEADLLQNRFDPTISELHCGAVRLGLHRARLGKVPWKSDEHFSGSKAFYAFLETQRRTSSVVPHLAPSSHSTYEHMSRCLYLADPTGAMGDYWPTETTTWAQLELELDGAFNYVHGNMFPATDGIAITQNNITIEQRVAWRVLLASVWAGQEKKPVLKPYKLPNLAPVVYCNHNVSSYHYCMACGKYVRPAGPDIVPLAPCGHGATAFSWCFVCRKPPSEQAIRCETHCRGWGSCVVCASLNLVLARVVGCVRNMEKI